MGGVAALICAVSFALFMLATVVVVLKLSRAMTIANRILNDIRREIVPLISKFQTTMDHVNAEMGYMDGILKSTEKLAVRANSATKAAQRIVTSPVVRILSLGLGVQRALGFTSPGKEKTAASKDNP